MIRKRRFWAFIATTSFALLLLVVFSWIDGNATSAQQPKVNTGDPKDPATTPPPDIATLARQVTELQKQVAELQTRLGATQTPHIVAAGTATYVRNEEQDNKKTTRVKLNADITAKLGDDYIVLLTNRFPTGGYPFFSVYWKKANDGFDVSLVDVDIADGGSASYDNKNKTYLIDWIVVKK